MHFNRFLPTYNLTLEPAVSRGRYSARDLKALLVPLKRCGTAACASMLSTGVVIMSLTLEDRLAPVSWIGCLHGDHA
jgi:hypothetical protein